MFRTQSTFRRITTSILMFTILGFSSITGIESAHADTLTPSSITITSVKKLDGSSIKVNEWFDISFKFTNANTGAAVQPPSLFVTCKDQNGQESGPSYVGSDGTGSCSMRELSVGPFTFTARFPGDTKYAASTSAPSSPLTLEKGTQLIQVNSVTIGYNFGKDTATFGDTWTISGVLGSTNNPFLYSIDPTTTANCSVNSKNVMTFTHPGTCLLNINQAGDANYLPADQVQKTINVERLQFPDLTPTNVPSAPAVGDTWTPAFAVIVPGSPITVTDAKDMWNPACTVTGGVVTFVSLGSCKIAASLPESDYANAYTANPTLTVKNKGTQVITFNSSAPLASQSGPTYTPNVTSNSKLSVTLTIDASSTSVCSISSGVVSFKAIGNCLINANQAGDANWTAATQTQQTVTVRNAQTVAFTSTAPTGLTYGAAPNYTPVATGGASGNAVTFSVAKGSEAVCSVAKGVVSFIGAGDCVVQADQAGSSTYHPATATQKITVAKASQTISISSPTASPKAGLTYTMPGSSTSGLTISYASTSQAVCTVSGAVVTFLTVGNCVINANQAGDTNYNAATQVSQTLVVAKGTQVLTFATPTPLATVGAKISMPTATSNAGLSVTVTVDSSSSKICSYDWFWGVVTYSAVGNCVFNANQSSGNSNYNAATQVQMTIQIRNVQSLTFTSVAPSAATVGGATYTPATKGGASNTAVTVSIDATSANVCTIASGVVSFTGIGTCLINANQAGNDTYHPATASQSFTVSKGSQTVAFTSIVPSSPKAGDTYTVAASATSKLAVSYTIDSASTAVCSIKDAVVTFTTAGSCVINANQAGDANYSAATQVQQTVTIGKGSQTVAFTSIVPANPKIGDTYTVAASATSKLAVSYTIDSASTAVCSIKDAVVTFTTAGSCVINANQAGNANYSAATQVQQTVTIGKGSQTVAFTSIAPAATVGGSTYTPTATGGGSGNAVVFTIDSSSSAVCSISGGKVSFLKNGTCVINANQDGNASYNAATQVQQSVVVKGTQTVRFTSTATSPVVGGKYTPVATGGSSGSAVTLTIDSMATGVCSITSGVVSFLKAGTCTINANQAGNADYNAAAQVQQSVTVGKASQSISFTSTVPTGATYLGSYTPTAKGGASGSTVVISIDASSASVCTYNGTKVSFVGVGNCVINANQAGNADYNAASQVQQKIAVGKASQTITITSKAPAGKVKGTYTPIATSTSKLAVVFTIAPASASVCKIASGKITFNKVGTCTIYANQAGNQFYSPAKQVTQAVIVK